MSAALTRAPHGGGRRGLEDPVEVSDELLAPAPENPEPEQDP